MYHVTAANLFKLYVRFPVLVLQAIATAVAAFDECQAELFVAADAGNSTASCNVAAAGFDNSSSTDALVEIIEDTIAISGCNGSAEAITNETGVVCTPQAIPYLMRSDMLVEYVVSAVMPSCVSVTA